jgi:hypothetical protein
MIVLDKEKIITYEEPGCFGNPPTSRSCISLDYAHELIREANLEIEELYKQIADFSKSDAIGKVPLTLNHVCSTVATFTKLPFSKVKEYAEKVYQPDNWALHFVSIDGVWAIESAIKIKDCDLVTFVRNFKSMVDCSSETRMPVSKFEDYTKMLFAEFKKQNNIE